MHPIELPGFRSGVRRLVLVASVDKVRWLVLMKLALD